MIAGRNLKGVLTFLLSRTSMRPQTTNLNCPHMNSVRSSIKRVSRKQPSANHWYRFGVVTREAEDKPRKFVRHGSTHLVSVGGDSEPMSGLDGRGRGTRDPPTRVLILQMYLAECELPKWKTWDALQTERRLGGACIPPGCNEQLV